MRSRFVLAGTTGLLLLGLGLLRAQSPVGPGQASAPATVSGHPVAAVLSRPPSQAEATLAAAAQHNSYVFILFWKEDSPATRGVKQTLDTALAKRSGQAMSVLVRTNDPTEKALVDQFGVSRSPMPLVLAVAPNGAITGGFPLKLTERDVAGAFVSPGLANCLRAVQARKLVLLCVQPAGGSAGLPAGVSEVKADPQYGPATEVVTVRADDAAETTLLKALALNPKPGVVMTALIVPPGRRLAVFEGSFTKEQVARSLTSAQGCCPGGKCGPGGCCPGGKCGPK
jgi:hypothetical protein